ncbi:hypothetical protein [Azospirillum oleiclasticum]|uniref:hypothetical protein n=1 Tax=Azospirillum oleiclasticum TaxID=2735135 RepID=UPI001B3BE81F|nr:hypothetical protein [Azospirillum oleiclasticum]
MSAFRARQQASIPTAPPSSTVREDSPHPPMHRTESVDYGVVIDGEVVLVLDGGRIC